MCVGAWVVYEVKQFVLYKQSWKVLIITLCFNYEYYKIH